MAHTLLPQPDGWYGLYGRCCAKFLAACKLPLLMFYIMLKVYKKPSTKIDIEEGETTEEGREENGKQAADIARQKPITTSRAF